MSIKSIMIAAGAVMAARDRRAVTPLRRLDGRMDAAEQDSGSKTSETRCA
jgi:hypothetical protein